MTTTADATQFQKKIVLRVIPDAMCSYKQIRAPQVQDKSMTI